ncbi:MAG: 4-alpha-glucanotransferase, partial [Chlamydiae bacterium]|nr:4-alpha-glucanotransferase [Chlamydiota bacterium]
DEQLIERISSLRASLDIRASFAQVLARKEQFFSLYFQKTKELFLHDTTCMRFLKETPWLDAYALFKGARHPDALLLHKVLQYLCFTQLTAVKEQATKEGVLLKGDIPILISPNSVDVWTHPELFDTTLGAGAPPDQYCKEGQSWGFPIFRLDNMRQENYAWWKERLRYAENFYDLYRIDHAVGLFRLWSIPHGKPSTLGHFTPPDERLWGVQGKEILEMMIHSSSMLPIAEDLGIIPPITHTVLRTLGIPGTKVMRWERDWSAHQNFIDPKNYPEVSLTCVSTHDSPTLEGWWRDFPEEASLYAKQKGFIYSAKITEEQRAEILRESLHSSSLFHINLLPEYLALVPEFVSKDPDKERINVPGTFLPSNWAYRLQKPVEEVTSSSSLREKIRKLIL